MAKSKSLDKALAERVLVVGRNPEGLCVYTSFLSVTDYYDGEHPWDDARAIKRLRLRTVHGHVFGEKGELEQEFETTFDVATGAYESGWCRLADGTLQA